MCFGRSPSKCSKSGHVVHLFFFSKFFGSTVSVTSKKALRFLIYSGRSCVNIYAAKLFKSEELEIR